MVSSKRTALNNVGKADKSTELIIDEMMNVIYKIYPSLASKLTKRDACKVIDTIVASYMMCNGSFIPRDCIQDRKVYAKQMMTYDSEVREIADSLGLDQTVVVEFVRGCFEINGTNGIYPSSNQNTSSLWSAYRNLRKTFSEPIAKTIIKYMRMPINAKWLRNEFKTFAQTVRLYTPMPPHALFIIEACDYIARIYADRNVAAGQSTKIFVDEFVNHLREFDEVRYLKYEEDIATFLERVDESFTPDCCAILNALGLNKLDSCILRIRNGFKWFPLDQNNRPDCPLTPVASPHLDAPGEWALPPPSISGPLALTRVATVAERMSKDDFEDDDANHADDADDADDGEDEGDDDGEDDGGDDGEDEGDDDA